MTRISKDGWELLGPLLDEALELSPEAREAWLAQRRIEHPTLIAQVEELISREAVADREGFLNVGQVAAIPNGASSLAGQTLGPYTLERPLGHGGMGSVWLARRSDGRFEGTAAIKFLSLAVAGPAGEARFHQEGNVLARLTHPNVARLLDAGVSPVGQPYLVLEYVDGQPIDAWCDERTLTTDARLRLFLQVLAAVAHAHANLIVHRDLKPSNILVARDGTVKLLDFGIAKLLEGSTADRGRLTGSHDAVLTFEYASPEQIRDDPISTATDVYGSGVVLYKLLAGRHPNGDVHTPAERVRAVLEADPVPLSRAVMPDGGLSPEDARRLAAARSASPEKLRRMFAGDLDNILSKALRKSAAERYPTVTDLADDIARYLAHEPVTARPDAWSYRASRFVRRHRGAVGAAALVALALSASTIATAFQAREASRQRDAAIYQSKRADAQIAFQSLLMSEVGDKPITMRQILDRGRLMLEQQYAGDEQFLPAILLQIASSYADLGDTKIRAALLTRAESLALSGQGADRLAEIRCQMVDNLRSQGRYPAAWSLMGRAESTLRRNPNPATRVDCLQIRSLLAIETGRADQSAAAIRHAVAIKDTLGETKDIKYVDLLSAYGEVLESAGQYRQSIAIDQRAIRILDNIGRGGMISRNSLRHNWALTLVELGELTEAEDILHETVELSARSDTGRIHWQPLVHYAETALFEGRLDSALKYFGKIVAQAVADTNLYWEGRGLYGMARTEVQLRRLADARRRLPRLQQILVTYPHVQATDDVLPDVVTLQGLLARADGNVATAHERFLQALTSNGYFAGKQKKRLRPLAVLAAETGLALGRSDEALDIAGRVRTSATLDSLSDSRSAYVGEARLIEGRALLLKHDTSGARAALERALSALRVGAGPQHPRTREATSLLASLK
jgi:serine/threonine-protein kinase